MPASTPEQARTRARFEALIGLGAPLLDLLLAAGDRVSRAVGPDDPPIPIRPSSDRLELGPGRRLP